MSLEPPLAGTRRLEALRHALGEAALAALADPQVVEILANPDGRLVLDHLQRGRFDTGVRLSAGDRDRAVRLVADHVGEVVDAADPRVSGVLPGGGERFQAVLPPVSTGPAWSIRKRPALIWRLDDYVRGGVMSPAQAEALKDAAVDRRNILISGGTGSGKTTLANAVLAEPAFAEDRVFLIEDTPELQCAAWDLVSVLTRRRPRVIGVADLVRDALRMRPDRIIIGEVRDGAAALEMLKSWNTGHPGGLSTVHANSAQDVVRRLEDLLGEVVSQAPTRLIVQAVDLIVHVRRTATGRRVEGMVAVEPGEASTGEHGVRLLQVA